MANNSFNDTLIAKVNESKEVVRGSLFKKWIAAPNQVERELIHSKATVLDDVCRALIKNIRGDE